MILAVALQFFYSVWRVSSTVFFATMPGSALFRKLLSERKREDRHEYVLRRKDTKVTFRPRSASSLRDLL